MRANATVSRRALSLGAAWSVPVVAVAASAPAYAASCQSTAVATMNLATRTGTDGNRVTITGVATQGLSVGPYNLRTDDTTQMPAGWLELENQPRGSAGSTNPTVYQDVTLSFDRPVTELAFTIADLDSNGGSNGRNYWDAIGIHSIDGGGSYVGVRGADVTGTGTLSAPWRQADFTAGASTNTDVRHQVAVSFGGRVNRLTFRYWSIDGRSGYSGTQAVWLGNMTYKSNCI